MSKPGHTPMMAQYLGLKEQHPDSILLFRMGDFYETFYDDAKDVASLLGIALTARDRKSGQAIPLAGVPHHALDHYLVKLLDAGRTVAICEQMEDPSQSKGLVRRDVVEVISPGTVTNPALLGDGDARYLLALAPGDDGLAGYALLDGSTGEFRCGEGSAEEIAALPRRFPIGEWIASESSAGQGAWARLFGDVPCQELSPLLFETGFARRVLEEHFAVQGLVGLGLEDLPLATRAAGAALRYLGDRQRRRPSQVDRIHLESSTVRLHIDRESIAHLELFHSLRQGDRRATLLHQLDRTRSAMGRRELARWLRAPLCQAEAIHARHGLVEWFVEHPLQRERVREALRGSGDLERLGGRIATERALPHELAALRSTLQRLPALLEALDETGLSLRRRLDAASVALLPLRDELLRALVEEPPPHLRQGGVLCAGYDGELDELLSLSRGGKQWIAGYQERERERTGISSLRVSYHKVFGYHIEVTNPHLAKVPDEYEEKQKLATGKRFVTQELAERERQILSADERRVAREQELFASLVHGIQERHGTRLRELAQLLAEIDVFASLAEVAHRRAWVRPQIDEGLGLEIEAGRHPVVEELVDEPFVPNDLSLDPGERQLLLLTGPNMGGKSTYLRQAALFVVLAQMGSFVPARRARIGLVDRVFTRVGASDDLARGQSTFLVEMAETANILRNATSRSLVVLDEVGRGTSTQDGLALAWAITEYLHDGEARPKTLFATHYHELTVLAEALARAANIQMQVRDEAGRILFLHEVIPGASDRSYGIHVAELAGMPRPVLRRAQELLERGTPGPDATPPAAAPAATRRQMELFGGAERDVLAELRSLDPERLRPLDALNLLAELRARLDRD